MKNARKVLAAIGDSVAIGRADQLDDLWYAARERAEGW